MSYVLSSSDLSLLITDKASLRSFFFLYSSNLHFAVIQTQCSLLSLPALFLHLFNVKQIKIQGHCCATVSVTNQ